MSVLTLQVGQCGNQLGHDVFDTLAATAAAAPPAEQDKIRDMYFRAGADARKPLAARAALVDMEPKVVERCVARARKGGRFEYTPSKLDKQEGSANNWAFGYHVQAMACLDKILDNVHAELEKMDALRGVQLLHSVGGGTGSGVGSHVLEILRDLHPRAPIVTTSVLPLRGGEVVTQHYNAVLTLAHLQRYADATVLIDNSRVMHHLASSGGGGNVLAPGEASGPPAGGAAKPAAATIGFEEMNVTIAADLAAGVLLPSRWDEGAGPAPSSGYPYASVRAKGAVQLLHDFVDAVAPHPSLKFVSVYTARGSAVDATARWNVVLRDLKRRLPTATASPSLLTLRGDVVKPVGGLSRIDLACPADLFGPLNKAARGCALKTPLCGQHGSATLVANSPHAVIDGVSGVVQRAAEMAGCGAYFHHFARYGLERDDCDAALATVEQMLKDYRGCL
eukprot:TRINITY_DN5699_c0_g1_i1.p2 TRINITY_DN5699_c0_g1~~TRINITY_DN5699_c0_g1_i1.p2  ORF type:complete len:450 (+),score=164.79 TRINITY_DN5699_c0_g1_i1:75-1424(+)